MKKEDKAKLNVELGEIRRKKILANARIKNSPEYKQIEKTQEELGNKLKEQKNKEVILTNPIYKKYVYNAYNLNGYFRGFEPNNIKSSVKQGIKKGLGITNVTLINEYDLRDIVKQLVDRDLEEIKEQTDEVKHKIEDITAQLKKGYEKKDRLTVGKLNLLDKQEAKLWNKLTSEKMAVEEKKRQLRIKIKNNLPKFMDEIAKEVDKRLILEGLEE